MKKTRLPLALCSWLIINSVAFANTDIKTLQQEIKQLKETTNSLIDEISDLKTGFNYTTVNTKKFYSGLGSAASKVYYSKSPLSIGGYGEIYYSNTRSDKNSSSQTQVKRFVTYIGYRFNDNIILNTEIEYEGGGVTASGGGDEITVEFMYLDFLLNKHFNIRAGNFLMPVGLFNQKHEPVLFTTVQRPSTAKYLIPTTWNESGIMAYGSIIDGIRYKLALTSALQTSVNGDKWIRNGRGGSSVVTDPTLAIIARLDYTAINGLLIGASTYYAPNSTTTYSIIKTNSNIFMYDIHLDYKNNGFRAYGVYTKTVRSNSSKIATNTGAQYVAKEGSGGYINLGYNLLALTSSKYSMPLFIQYENYNPQRKVSSSIYSFNSTSTTTIGINFFPQDQVVLKVDYAMSKQGGIDANTASASIGFIF